MIGPKNKSAKAGGKIRAPARVRTITTRQGGYQARQIAAGKCPDCGQPCTGYRCGQCKARVRARQKLLMRERRALGLA